MSLTKSVSDIKGNTLRKLWAPVLMTPPRNSKPNFIIKWGPPASGKTQSLKGIISQLGAPLDSYINFSVDDPVEATTFFKNTSLRLADNYLKNVNKTENAIVTKLNTIINRNVAPFKKAYMNVRRAANNEGKSFGNKLSDMLFEAIQQRRNITFETTGSSQSLWNIPAWPTWIWTKVPNLSSIYNVIVLFPLVPFETTWERYRRRAVQMYLRRNGFRFAASKRQLLDSYLTSYRNFARNLSSVGKMEKVSRIIVVPHKFPVIEWKPGDIRNKGRAGLRSRNRQTMLELVNKYIEHIPNRNFN